MFVIELDHLDVLGMCVYSIRSVVSYRVNYSLLPYLICAVMVKSLNTIDRYGKWISENRDGLMFLFVHHIYLQYELFMRNFDEEI
jgi:hypothetical protein